MMTLFVLVLLLVFWRQVILALDVVILITVGTLKVITHMMTKQDPIKK